MRSSTSEASYLHKDARTKTMLGLQIAWCSVALGFAVLLVLVAAFSVMLFFIHVGENESRSSLTDWHAYRKELMNFEVLDCLLVVPLVVCLLTCCQSCWCVGGFSSCLKKPQEEESERSHGGNPDPELGISIPARIASRAVVVVGYGLPNDEPDEYSLTQAQLNCFANGVDSRPLGAQEQVGRPSPRNSAQQGPIKPAPGRGQKACDREGQGEASDKTDRFRHILSNLEVVLESSSEHLP